MKLTVGEICAACGATLLQGEPAVEIDGFETDSRKELVGKLFVPVVGERVDGHDFIGKAFAAGAAAAFTQRPIEGAAGPLLLVENSVLALQQAAGAYRDHFAVPFVGITGSVGKTTTKEFVALALSAGKEVMKTQGNQNSQIGLPMTLCRLEPATQVAVVEMGMSRFGEMARLAAAAKPNCAVMTNIGVSHIEFLKTRENILREKLHITDAFTADSVLFVNGDDDLLCTVIGQMPFRVVSFGINGDWDYTAREIREGTESVDFLCVAKSGTYPVHVPVAGAHNVRNALAAIAVAEHCGVPAKLAAEKIAAYTAPPMRQQVYACRNITVIDDSYNASPDSMRAALDLLCGQKEAGRRIAVLGDMFELGDYEEAGHRQVGQYAAQKEIDVLVAVGKAAHFIYEGFLCAQGKQAVWVENNEQAIATLHSLRKAGDCVLVKASRGMHTEQIVQALREETEK